MRSQPALSRQEIDALHQRLSNWGRFGERDQLGTLNLITAEKRIGAAKSVRTGRAVGCARPLPTEPAPDNPNPVVHLMVGGGEAWGADYFAIAPHGMATSHIDALCHIFHEGRLYNGYSTDRVTGRGAFELAIHELRDGVASRGVLLDVPRARDVPFVEAGGAIFPEDLERAEAVGDVEVEAGDIVFIRTGRWDERRANGPRPPAEGLAGLDARCLAWLHERGVAALGSDGVSDVMPSGVDGYALPIHSVAIVAMGLHLLDNLDLDRLAAACIEEARCDFQLSIGPLVLQNGTASPVNPIALF